MCVVSNIGDWAKQQQWPALPSQPLSPQYGTIDHQARDQIAALEHQVAELKKLIEAAKAFDKATGQPDCEDKSKFEFLERIEQAIKEYREADGKVAG